MTLPTLPEAPMQRIEARQHFWLDGILILQGTRLSVPRFVARALCRQWKATAIGKAT